MDLKKSESDDDYWGSAHKGFDFGDNDWQSQLRGSKLSTSVRKDDGTNQFDLLKFDGLDGVVENKPSDDSLAFHVSTPDHQILSSKLSKLSFFDLQQKSEPKGKTLSVSETVKNIIFGREYSLDAYKGKEEKIELLKCAIKSHDGNAILAVVVFLRNTLKKSIFQREIMVYPDAVNTYLSYLEEDHESDELANMLLLLNKADDAAMSKYETIVLVQDPERKRKWIENCLSTHFQPGSVSTFLWASVSEHKYLLDEQIALQKYHNTKAPKEDEIFERFVNLTGKTKLVDSSVVCSLIFCFLYYYHSIEPNFTSRDSIKTRFRLSKKQYTWAAIRALSCTSMWAEMEDMFKTKNWRGVVKLKSCIDFAKVLEILSMNKAPYEVMTKYIWCIENEAEKIELAKKYKCHYIVIEHLKNNKDRIGLLEYKATLPPHSVDFCTITDVLNNRAIKWRN